MAKDEADFPKARSLELWDLDIGELTGHNIETAGREEVNRMLQEGWILLHIYTLKYREDDAWRERPMAILGKPGSRRDKATTENKVKRRNKKQQTDYKQTSL